MMIDIYIDGDYKAITEEDYKAQFGCDVEAPTPEPTAEERLAALEAAVAEIALMSVQEKG